MAADAGARLARTQAQSQAAVSIESSVRQPQASVSIGSSVSQASVSIESSVLQRPLSQQRIPTVSTVAHELVAPHVTHGGCFTRPIGCSGSTASPPAGCAPAGGATATSSLPCLATRSTSACFCHTLTLSSPSAGRPEPRVERVNGDGWVRRQALQLKAAAPLADLASRAAAAVSTDSCHPIRPKPRGKCALRLANSASAPELSRPARARRAGAACRYAEVVAAASAASLESVWLSRAVHQGRVAVVDGAPVLLALDGR